MNQELKYIVEIGHGKTFIWEKTSLNVFSVVGKQIGEINGGSYTQCYEGEVPKTLKQFGYEIICQTSDNIEVKPKHEVRYIIPNYESMTIRELIIEGSEIKAKIRELEKWDSLIEAVLMNGMYKKEVIN